MVAYLQSPKNNKVDDYLVKKAYRNSLFFNKKFNLILEQI